MDRRKIKLEQEIADGEGVDRWVHSTCNLCSVGCGTEIAVRNNKMVGIRGINEHPINKGRLIQKQNISGYRTIARTGLQPR